MLSTWLQHLVVLGKVNALLDGAGQLWDGLLQCILLIRTEPAWQAVHLLNACSIKPLNQSIWIRRLSLNCIAEILTQAQLL